MANHGTVKIHFWIQKVRIAQTKGRSLEIQEEDSRQPTTTLLGAQERPRNNAMRKTVSVCVSATFVRKQKDR
jgi:hypothetical protein